MTQELKEYMDEHFARLEALSLMAAKTILNAEEAARYIGASIKVIYRMTWNKTIPHYKQNGKLFFKKTELDDWMTENRIMTTQEINSKASTYVATH